VVVPSPMGVPTRTRGSISFAFFPFPSFGPFPCFSPRKREEGVVDGGGAVSVAVRPYGGDSSRRGASLIARRAFPSDAGVVPSTPEDCRNGRGRERHIVATGNESSSWGFSLLMGGVA